MATQPKDTARKYTHSSIRQTGWHKDRYTYEMPRQYRAPTAAELAPRRTPKQ